ncbi:MAG: GNAT family N-acetyltransferase [Usitatibacter sp.]
MGSIEAFPANRDASRRRRAANAWRRTPVPGISPVRVRPARLEDFAAIRALQRFTHRDIPAWTLKQFESHRTAFPEGQLVAIADGEVVGAASCLVVRWDDYALAHTWKTITGDGYFTTHDTAGRTLYAAEVAVDASRHGSGIARALYQAQRRLCRRLNLRRIIAAARFAGYAAMKERMSAEHYARRVIWGDIQDPLLRLPMSQGFQYCGIIEGYLPEDHDSCGNAALIVWLNPLFSPTEPPADMEAERPRKCA